MKLFLVNSIRTNNFNDKEMMGKIKTMWEEAYRNLEQHQSSIYGVYYDYESNYKGDYSLSVAIEDVMGNPLLKYRKTKNTKFSRWIRVTNLGS
ncbi:hypothetical protein [Siminovitchia sp. 179-K 8D1 HS]|uniref:hypothetical protein n=1 Tax=Siminovitchia sp. 179-K 8D1 HS TaxID=3142385 RepID=UPI0039A18C9E